MGLRNAKSTTQAIPLLKRYSHGSTLSPKGFLKSLSAPWCPQQAVGTWHLARTQNMNWQSWTRTIAIWYISGLCFTNTISYVKNIKKPTLQSDIAKEKRYYRRYLCPMEHILHAVPCCLEILRYRKKGILRIGARIWQPKESAKTSN